MPQFLKTLVPESGAGAAILAFGAARLQGACDGHRAGILARLHAHRLPEALIHALIRGAEDAAKNDMADALAAALAARMSIAPLNFGRSRALLLLGPHGAGKSAVANKIAAQAEATGYSPVRLFAGHDTVSQIAKAVVGAGRKTVAIIDTPGFNPHDARSRTAFTALGAIRPVETIAVISAFGDAEEMSEFLPLLRADRLIVTGLDLARRLGALAAAVTGGATLAHVTRTAVGDGLLEHLTPVALARLLLRPVSAH